MDANTVQAKTITLPLWIVYQKRFNNGNLGQRLSAKRNAQLGLMKTSALFLLGI